mgnify:CR=1 FL=1
MSRPGFKRILLKLSGEVLMGDQPFGIHPETVARMAMEVKAAKDAGKAIKLIDLEGNTPELTILEPTDQLVP